MSKTQAGFYATYRLVWAGLDLIFPPVCAGCGKNGARWCTECQRILIPVPEPYCQICGTPQRSPGLCRTCSDSRPPYASLRSWAVFDGPVRGAIHRLKYRRDLGLGDALTDPVAESLKNCTWPIDVIVPVPLSGQRYKERGYNQIALVAFPLSLKMQVAYSSRILLRKRHTLSQVGLSANDRKKNVEGAFWADQEKVRGKSILLMDDVATTGSTLASASQALLDSGASKVYAYSLARALAHHGWDTV